MSGCVTSPPPYEEYSLARVAMKAAADADASRFATGLYNRAEENFRNGQKSYQDNDFDRAKKQFQMAIQFAEKAENATRLKKFQSGDTFP
ncbi:MAG: DUF4398 domain-containing protein [Bdellovibrionales bacterium]|nr:DUF4398 domain-containing protein [Bdellovibrionales bacterium]